jgi:integrase
MAQTKITLKIVSFKNPSGVVVYRVSGMILGTRVQKNFPTREEAERFMNGAVRTANQADSTTRERLTSTTFPTDEILREAEAAHRLLQKHGASLYAAANFYLAHANRQLTDLPALEALNKFMKKRRERGNRERTISVCEDVLKLFLRRHSIANVSDFTRAKADEFVSDSSIAKRTQLDRRQHLFNWARFLVKENHLVANFVEEIDRPNIERAEPTTLTVAQVHKLLNAAVVEKGGRTEVAGAMLPYFSICVLSGMRPDETKRLSWDNVSFENGILRGFKAKRVGHVRSVEMSENLKAILQACKKRGLSPGFFSKKAFDRTRKSAGLGEHWDNDILRHTYASHCWAWKRDLNYLVKNMGNSEDVLKQSYLNEGVIASEGHALFEIRPAGISKSLFGAPTKPDRGSRRPAEATPTAV